VKEPTSVSDNVFSVLRRLGDVGRTVFGLVDTVERLTRENKELRAKVDTLQREVDRQAGQISVMLSILRADGSSSNSRPTKPARTRRSKA
jgi:uncharacterized protein YoxC